MKKPVDKNLKKVGTAEKIFYVVTYFKYIEKFPHLLLFIAVFTYQYHHNKKIYFTSSHTTDSIRQTHS